MQISERPIYICKSPPPFASQGQVQLHFCVAFFFLPKFKKKKKYTNKYGSRSKNKEKRQWNYNKVCYFGQEATCSYLHSSSLCHHASVLVHSWRRIVLLVFPSTQFCFLTGWLAEWLLSSLVYD
ncbi:hypothetical protein HanIR_Chr16g0786781 [Helianthus annuus]|nr:hypothetical protein HanIR_Chr16g0786781 [Helianthus annuus]